MMMDFVGRLLNAAAADFVLPRFRALQSTDIHEKDGGEIVTTVDREVEAFLSHQLIDLLPGSLVVGEEAVASGSTSYDLLSGKAPIWLVDPLDGTANFVKGISCISIMVALIANGETVATWMLDPITGSLATCERGSGAFWNADRIRAPNTHGVGSLPRGAILKRFLPPNIRAEIENREAQVGTVLPGLMCAGHEYPTVAKGEQDFALFWRVEPWDHAPGVLFLEEAGGFAGRFDGSNYRPQDRRNGLLVARSRDVWENVSTALDLAAIEHD